MRCQSSAMLQAVIVLLTAHASVYGAELLRNGDFEIGKPEERQPKRFVAQAWRRQLWKPEIIKTWLTSDLYAPQVGKNNQAIIFTWDAATVYQDFSAAPNQEYAFRVSYMNAGNDSGWEPRIRVEWYDAAYK